jgi:hypothetical protein
MGRFVYSMAIITAVVVSINATPISFYNITQNSTVNAMIGEAQLSMEISETAGQVFFLFKKEGDQAAVIQAIAFDDASNELLSLSNTQIISTGVNFQYVSNYNLPGGNQPSIGFVSDYAYNAVSPSPINGVGPNELVSIPFNYAPGSSFNKVVSSINSGDLRVGLHVIAFADGGSESFINTASVPESSSLSLLSLGLLSIAGFRVSRRKAG